MMNRILVQFLNSTRNVVNFITFCCMISLIEALVLKEEIQMANYYKAEGALRWPWAMRPFCESTRIHEEWPGSFRSAYLTEENIILPLVNCNVIQIQSLTCLYRSVNEEGIFVWRQESYVNRLLDGQIYTFEVQPLKKGECYGIPLDTITYKEMIVSGGVHIPIETFSDEGQPPFLEKRRFATDFHQVATFYAVNGIPIEWKWEMQPFCESYSLEPFRSASIVTKEMTLEWGRCARIDIEVLVCEYDVGNDRAEDFYANGVDHAIFTVSPITDHSPCYDLFSADLKDLVVFDRKVVGGERRPITTRQSKASPYWGDWEVHSMLEIR